jgi:hypothetical protein
MTQPKKAGDTKSAFIIIALALLVFAASKYPFYFAAGAVILIGILVFAYIKVPKFHAFVNGKLNIKPKNGEKAWADYDKQVKQTTQIRQAETAYLCNKCGGQLEPVANWPKFMACEKCHKVQQKIN